MKNAGEKETLCSNEGCRRIAEKASRFCAACSLEWGLFHRDERGDEGSRFQVPGSREPDSALEP